MLSSDVLIKFMDINKSVLTRQFKGLTHEDSLLQLPFRGNCLNWVMGHMVEARDGTLEILNLDPMLTEEQRKLYTFDSEPITPESQALDFIWLWEVYQKQDERLREVLEPMTMDELEQITGDSERTLGDLLRFDFWHETYHVGQTEYLRQLTGVNDKVI